MTHQLTPALTLAPLTLIRTPHQLTLTLAPLTLTLTLTPTPH